MADPVAAPKVPPITVPFVDPKTGQISQPWYRYLVGEGGRIGSVNSGVAQARAEAAAAQATANAAAQQAADIGEEALAFSASASPTLASGGRLGPGDVTTNTVTVTQVGGTGPYIYSWALVSGDTFTVDSPSSATTSFSTTVTTAGQNKSATYRCTVTDSLAATCSVTVGVSASELS